MKKWFLLFLAFASIAHAQQVLYPMVNNSAYPGYENGSTPVPVYFGWSVLPSNGLAIANTFLAPINASGTRFRYYFAGRVKKPETTCIPGQGTVDILYQPTATPVTYCANGGFRVEVLDPLQPGLYPGWLNERGRLMGMSFAEWPNNGNDPSGGGTGDLRGTVTAARNYLNGSVRLFPVMANKVVPGVAAPEMANISATGTRSANAGRTTACFTKAGLDAYICLEQRLDGRWFLTRTSFSHPAGTDYVCFSQTQVNCSNSVYVLPDTDNFLETMTLTYDPGRNVVLVTSAYRIYVSFDLGSSWSGPVMTNASFLAHTTSYSPALQRIIMVGDDFSAGIQYVRPSALIINTATWTWTKEFFPNVTTTLASGYFGASLDCTQTLKRGTPPTQAQTPFCSFVYIDANFERVVRRFSFQPRDLNDFHHDVTGTIVTGFDGIRAEADAVAHYTCGESYPLRGSTPTDGCDRIYAILGGYTNGTWLATTRWDTTTWPDWHNWELTNIDNGLGPATIQSGLKLVYRHADSSWYLLTRSAPYDVNF